MHDLVAIGQTDGRIRLSHLMHLNGQEGFSLSNLNAQQYFESQLISEYFSYPDLPVRYSRACNTLSFCQNSPNLLACGLDRAKAHAGLLIWDIEMARLLLERAMKDLQTSLIIADAGYSVASGRASPTESDGTYHRERESVNTPNLPTRSLFGRSNAPQFSYVAVMHC